MAKKIKQIILVYEDGSTKGYNYPAWLSRLKIEKDFRKI